MVVRSRRIADRVAARSFPAAHLEGWHNSLRGHAGVNSGMTQVITAFSKEYVLLVADRRLTFLNGPTQGQLADDDTCKLVSLCNTSGIGYTGLARIAGIPTHEWIAKTLASEGCSDPGKASRILSERAKIALSQVPPNLRRQTFVIAGWAQFTNLTGFRSYVCAITNMMDASGQNLAMADETFKIWVKPLREEEDLVIQVIGQPLHTDRMRGLERNLRNLVTRALSPKAALRLLVDEVINSSKQFHTVG